MPSREGKPSAGSEKKARRKALSEPPVDIEREPSRLSPTDRLESARSEHLRSLENHIGSLEEDKGRLEEKVEKLQAVVDRLGPENARLREAHANAVVNNILATIFVAVGGGSISFATFVAGASKVVAWVGAALPGAGVVILVLATLRGRSMKPAQPS